MLINRAGGGGGSLDITNGRIEDLYAAGEDVPANTFVELLSYLHDDPDHPAVTINGHYEIDANLPEKLSKIVQLEGNVYLIFVERTVHLCVIDKNNASIIETKELVTNSGFQFEDASKMSEGSAIVVFKMGAGYAPMCRVIVDVDENNRLNTTSTHTISSSYYVSKARIARLSDNKVIVIWTQTDGATSTKTSIKAKIITGGTYTNEQTVAADLFDKKPFYFKLASSESRVLCAFSISDFGYTAYLLSFDINGNVVANTRPLVRVNALGQDVSEWNMLPIGDQRFLILDGRNDLGNVMFSSIFATIVTMNQNHLLIGDSRKLLAEKIALNIGDSGDDFEPLGIIVHSNNTLCAVAKLTKLMKTSINSYDVIAQEHLALFIDTTLDDYPQKIGLSTLIEDSEYTAVSDSSIFMLDNGSIAFLATSNNYSNINFWLYEKGELVNVVQKSISKIDGLTKTQATTEQTGKVWLLDSPGI